MELINTHCHSKYCGHGEGEIAEYAALAEAAHLTTLAFTEHYPLSEAFDPQGYLSVPAKDMAAYEGAVLSAREQYPSMEILLGIELDYLSSTDDRQLDEEELASFDLILGSVHFVDRWPFDDPAQRDAWDEEGAVDRIWERYVDLWCEAAADRSQPFDIMSHPDLAKKFAFYPTQPLQSLYDRMAEAAQAGERMIEVNTSGLFYACKEMFPSLDLLKTFRRAGIPCTVGTDAHKPAVVARLIQEGYDLMAEAGYSEVTVPERGHGRRVIPIE